MVTKLLVLAGLVLVVSACGGSDDSLGLGSPSTPDAATPATTTGGTTPPASDDVFATLQAGCADGDYAICDLLFFASEADSDLEAFGDTCGERVGSGGGFCASQFNVSVDFDELRPMCADGDMVACDKLFLYSEVDSVDEAFGATCGSRIEADLLCVVEFGLFAD